MSNDVNSEKSKSAVSDEYKPISMWGYFGYEILFSIPIVGQIILIVMSFVAKNKNVKNFARSYFCLFIIAVIVSVIVITVGGFSSGSFF